MTQSYVRVSIEENTNVTQESKRLSIKLLGPHVSYKHIKVGNGDGRKHGKHTGIEKVQKGNVKALVRRNARRNNVGTCTEKSTVSSKTSSKT